MTANRRAKGRRLEKKEAEAWRAAGWTVEDGHPFRGMMRAKGFAIPRLGDLFERYDLMAAWGHTLVLIQVSTEGESHTLAPLGLMALSQEELRLTPNYIMEVPQTLTALFGLYEEFSGIRESPVPGKSQVLEVYTYYRILKGKRGYQADRRWWMPPADPSSTPVPERRVPASSGNLSGSAPPGTAFSGGA